MIRSPWPAPEPAGFHHAPSPLRRGARLLPVATMLVTALATTLPSQATRAPQAISRLPLTGVGAYAWLGPGTLIAWTRAGRASHGEIVDVATGRARTLPYLTAIARSWTSTSAWAADPRGRYLVCRYTRGPVIEANEYWGVFNIRSGKHYSWRARNVVAADWFSDGLHWASLVYSPFYPTITIRSWRAPARGRDVRLAPPNLDGYSLFRVLPKQRVMVGSTERRPHRHSGLELYEYSLRDGDHYDEIDVNPEGDGEIAAAAIAPSGGSLAWCQRPVPSAGASHGRSNRPNARPDHMTFWLADLRRPAPLRRVADVRTAGGSEDSCDGSCDCSLQWSPDGRRLALLIGGALYIVRCGSGDTASRGVSLPALPTK